MGEATIVICLIKISFRALVKMISISQKLLNCGRAGGNSAVQFARQFTATASFRQSEFEDDQPAQQREKFVNKISLYGTVGRAPEEFGAEGKEVTIFPLLTKSYHGPMGNKTEEKHWHKVMITNVQKGQRVWAQNNLDPGDKVLVSGTIQYKQIDRDNTDAGVMTTITADTTILAEKRPSRD